MNKPDTFFFMIHLETPDHFFYLIYASPIFHLQKNIRIYYTETIRQASFDPDIIMNRKKDLHMAGSTFGTIFRISTWGESHGKGIGVVVDGCPAGIPLCEEDIQQDLNRRKPGQNRYTTARSESDTVEILSGVFEGKTTGTPISLLIRNQDQRSRDYGNLAKLYRPGHADYSFDQKYGFRDYRGGGRSSGRETIGRVAAGAIESRSRSAAFSKRKRPWTKRQKTLRLKKKKSLAA